MTAAFPAIRNFPNFHDGIPGIMGRKTWSFGPSTSRLACCFTSDNSSKFFWVLHKRFVGCLQSHERAFFKHVSSDTWICLYWTSKKNSISSSLSSCLFPSKHPWNLTFRWTPCVMMSSPGLPNGLDIVSSTSYPGKNKKICRNSHSGSKKMVYLLQHVWFVFLVRLFQGFAAWQAKSST